MGETGRSKAYFTPWKWTVLVSQFECHFESFKSGFLNRWPVVEWTSILALGGNGWSFIKLNVYATKGSRIWKCTVQFEMQRPSTFVSDVPLYTQWIQMNLIFVCSDLFAHWAKSLSNQSWFENLVRKLSINYFHWWNRCNCNETIWRSDRCRSWSSTYPSRTFESNGWFRPISERQSYHGHE